MTERIFVIWSNPLFRDSVQVLLKHPDVTCVGIMNGSEVEVGKILTAEPNAILVEEVEGKVPGEVMELLERRRFSGRLIAFNLADNRLHTFHREESTPGHADDLLKLILG